MNGIARPVAVCPDAAAKKSHAQEASPFGHARVLAKRHAKHLPFSVYSILYRGQ